VPTSIFNSAQDISSESLPGSETSVQLAEMGGMRWRRTIAKYPAKEEEQPFDEDEIDKESPSPSKAIIGLSLCMLIIGGTIGWMCSGKSNEKKPEPTNPQPSTTTVDVQPAKSTASSSLSDVMEKVEKEVKAKDQLYDRNDKPIDTPPTFSYAPGDFGLG
ncbi:hypothetical protein PMAYCL1PPCAC_05525, partial [Pristionchus mayeri]